MIRPLHAIPPLLATTVRGASVGVQPQGLKRRRSAGTYFTSIRGLIHKLTGHVSLHSRLPVSLADVLLVHNRGRSRQCTCLGPHVLLHHGTRILSSPQLRGRQFTWRHCCHGSKHGISTLTLLEAGRGLLSRCCPVQRPPHFPDWMEEEGEWVRDGFASDLALPSRVALPLFGNLAAQWPFSQQLQQFLRLEYRSSLGDLSLDFSRESLGDIHSRGRRSDLSLSLRGDSMRFLPASRERLENRDDAEERLRS